jgi:hypothetical protein
MVYESIVVQCSNHDRCDRWWKDLYWHRAECKHYRPHPWDNSHNHGKYHTPCSGLTKCDRMNVLVQCNRVKPHPAHPEGAPSSGT